ncbi:MAG TPA: phospholipase D-like domain-containing protein [Ktedonobacterales bacterium]
MPQVQHQEFDLTSGEPLPSVTRRTGLRRVLWAIAGAFVGAQVSVTLALIIIASVRKLRAPVHGFPHSRNSEVKVQGNYLRVYTYGRELYDAMLEAINAAHSHIYMESYIWKADDVGEEFKEALAKKAAEGVEVYVIFDNVGNLVVPDSFKKFPKPINAMRFTAVHHWWHYFDPRRYVLDHRKILVVDDEIAFVGGYNIGSLYATQWRDTHLRLSGPDVVDFSYSFVEFWNRFCSHERRIAHRTVRRFEPTITLHLNDALHLTFPIRNMYIDAIERAQRHIYLTTAYFIPDHVMLDSLKRAVSRGVDVQILLPWTSNHVLADWAAHGYFSECLAAKIRIFGFKQAMIHAKTCTIDGEWSTIGTANIDRLSSVGNFEINTEIYDAKLAEQMEAIFESDKSNAFELTTADWERRPWYVKASERLLAPLRILL